MHKPFVPGVVLSKADREENDRAAAEMASCNDAESGELFAAHERARRKRQRESHKLYLARCERRAERASNARPLTHSPFAALAS